MLLGVVDTLMVGRVSVHALAAVSLGHLWCFGTMIFALGVIFGLDPILSQAHGRRDGRTLGLALQRGLVLAILLSVPLAVLWCFTEPALRLAGQDARLVDLARGYVWAQIPSLPAFMAFSVLRQYLQCRGIVRPTLVLVLAANVLNAFLNWIFIFGSLGVPALGVLGAGIATCVTRIALFLALLWMVLRFRLHRGAWTPWSRECLRVAGLLELLRYGIPVSIQIGLEVWAFQIATLLAGSLGDVALAGHAIVLNLASLSFMVPLGVSLGAVTRVGNLVGEGRRHRAQLAAWVSLGIGAGVMTISGLTFVFFRRELPAWYTHDANTIAAAAALLPIAGAFQLFDGTQVVGGGILRGMGRTVPAAAFNSIGYYVLALPLAYWLAFHEGFGLAGIWWGLCLGLGVIAVMLTVWIARRGPGVNRETP